MKLVFIAYLNILMKRLTSSPDRLGVKLTTLSQDQADYLNIAVEGLYKPDHYRY